MYYFLAMFLPWYEASSASHVFASFTLWVFREPVACAKNDDPFIRIEAGFCKAVMLGLALKSLHCLNPHDSRGKELFLSLSSLAHSEWITDPLSKNHSPLQLLACWCLCAVLLN